MYRRQVGYPVDGGGRLVETGSPSVPLDGRKRFSGVGYNLKHGHY